MPKIAIAVMLLVSAAVGVVLWLNGYADAGIGVVIAVYVLYIVARLVTKRMRPGGPVEEPAQEEEPPAQPDLWEEMREKALEALNRKLRGQKIAVDSFFRPAHTEYPALVKVRADLAGEVPELALRTDLEVLKLRLDAARTGSLLEEIPGRVKSEEALLEEIKKAAR